MLCSLRKWHISKTFDTGKTLSHSLKRHMNTCHGCRDFFQVGQDLQQMSPDAFAAPSEADISHLPQRIMTSLQADPVSEKPDRKRPFLIPALSSAAALVVFVLAVVVLIPSPSADLTLLNPLSQWGAAKSTVSSLWEDVQSPYQMEWENLKSSLNSAADFFLSFVDLPADIEE